jgi:hypothetical protein
MSTIKLTGYIGALLVLAGIGLVAFQMFGATGPLAPNVAKVSLTEWAFQTQRPGITLACIGGFLLVVSAILGRQSN